ncbi:MAG TPA: outer membrane beta-barrel protein, partial [Vicinamibacterales bacterium]|nr:outer membrane beta-barrel protein [Vicinamibacterales bacterium]
MQLKRVLFAVVLGGLMSIPAQARADWIFTPFIGANLHQDDDTLGVDTKNGTVNFGASLAWMGAGVFGVELDFGYAPNFFEQENASTFDGNVTTLMGNLIVGIPIGGQTGGGVRPYVSGGVGLI